MLRVLVEFSVLDLAYLLLCLVNGKMKSFVLYLIVRLGGRSSTGYDKGFLSIFKHLENRMLLNTKVRK